MATMVQERQASSEPVAPRLLLSSSPHIHAPLTTQQAMYTVLATLIPVLGAAIYVFGWRSAWVSLVCVLAAMATEALAQWARRRPPFGTLPDGSAAVTGLLLALTLPASTPYWMAVLGAVVSIALGKQAFGGLGQNVFNPALVGRVFLLVSFPQFLGNFQGAVRGVDTLTGATPLASLAQNKPVPSVLQLLAGFHPGSLGETVTAALLLGGLVLVLFGVIDWRIPVSIFATVALFAWAKGTDPLVHLLSGGLVLGAIYMATDWVTSPATSLGRWIYGIAIGVITMVIRLWGTYPEGVSFAILFVNTLVPLINRFTLPRPHVTKEVSARA